jgi:23S rRNA (cytosine1962-C5)-methyltransferase
VRLLNLFAYTGASTLAAAAAGAVVAHVDASRPVVQWARANATSSSLQAATIRWLVEDAQRFVQREIRRGNRYDALVLDPPSYGHGPKGERWRVTHDLLPLLEDCRKLLPERPACVLLTCHSPGYGPAELAAVLQEAMFGRCTSDVTAEDLYLKTSDGRRLHAGVSARFPAR